MFRSRQKPLWQRFAQIFMGQVCVFSTTQIQLANLKTFTVNAEKALKILRHNLWWPAPSIHYGTVQISTLIWNKLLYQNTELTNPTSQENH
jgi:hypothetical protein